MDDIAKMLLGNPENKKAQFIWADLNLFLTVILFKELCQRREDPEKYGRMVLSEWVDRIRAHAKSEADKIRFAKEESPLVAALMPDPDEIESTTQDISSDVVQAMIRSLKVEFDI